MELCQKRYEVISAAMYHIVAFCVLMCASLILIIIQTVFSYCVSAESDLSWPSVLIPFAYIAAFLLILTAGATLTAGLANSDEWDTASVVSCIFPLIVTTAIACTTIQQYVDGSLPKSSMLIMGIINSMIALLCFIHGILLCADFRLCINVKAHDSPPAMEVPICKITLEDGSVLLDDTNCMDSNDV
uniref:Transmembrane protein n=1 Tax=Schistosoma mansoni TaxID=6183 RepID=A0A3Q0KJ81_SCHMA